jgi:choline dehydrogenase
MQSDYIIVGAGSAGCVLANRLSEDGKRRVLLIEAGGSDRNPVQRIPMAGVLMNYGHARRDWRYQTQPDPSRNMRVEMWPRGKLLGGTSSMNGMIYVRGAQEDFDHWAALGNEGWSYGDVEPLFRRLEDHEFARGESGQSELYGSGGPLKVRQLKGVHPLSHIFVSACVALGIPINPHYNTGVQEGACVLTATHSGRVRYSSAQAFLAPIRSRRNLHVMKNTLVTRVLLNEKKAIGVRVSEGNGSQEWEIHSDQVILSAGVFNSPQLLMLSGIGPSQHLRDVSVPVYHALPGVGQNLQDHPNCPILARVNVPTLSARPAVIVKGAIEWLFLGTGPLTAAGCQALAFVKTHPELTEPDVQIHIMPLAFSVSNYRVKFLDSCITLLPNVSRPRSRGEMKLRSNNPYDPPAIYPNMLTNSEDVKVLIAAGRLCRQLLKTKAFRSYVEEEISPGEKVQSDREWEEFLRSAASSGAHPCGTCKMGIDQMAVVDPQLRVHGIERLRVIDASIMPTVPSGNINASCMMIGEKGAQLILQERNNSRANRNARCSP